MTQNTNAQRTTIADFKGRNNVTQLVNNDGAVSYLTASTAFNDEAYRLQACKLNTVETQKAHALFLLNGADAIVGKYYLCQALQGKTPAELVEMKHSLCFFESWNEETQQWVPCCSKSNGVDLSVGAVGF